MKRFAALALILSIGLFSIGCAETKPKPKKDGDKAKVEAGDDAKTDAATDDAKKEEEK